MKRILSERNLVVVLFVMVLITFCLAQEDSKKMERIYSGVSSAGSHIFLVNLQKIKPQKSALPHLIAAPAAE